MTEICNVFILDEKGHGEPCGSRARKDVSEVEVCLSCFRNNHDAVTEESTYPHRHEPNGTVYGRMGDSLKVPFDGTACENGHNLRARLVDLV